MVLVEKAPTDYLASVSATFGLEVVVIDSLTKEYLRKAPLLLVVVSQQQLPDLFKHSAWLELKHNVGASVVEAHYLHRCMAAGRFLPLTPSEEYFPSGGIVLSDTHSANAETPILQQARHRSSVARTRGRPRSTLRSSADRAPKPPDRPWLRASRHQPSRPSP